MSSVDINSPEESTVSSMSFSINLHLKRLSSYRAFGVLVKAFEPYYCVVILVFYYKIFNGHHHFLFTSIMLPFINVWVSVMVPQISFSPAS